MMRHIKYFLVGVLYMIAGILCVINIAYWWPWPMVIPPVAATYVAGRGISGGFKQPSDQEELERQNTTMRRGGGMVE